MVMAVRRVLVSCGGSRANIFSRESGRRQMIPLKRLVRDGCWVKCTAKNKFHGREPAEWEFRIRVLSFERLDYSQIEKPERLRPVEAGAALWLMKLELVKVSKDSAYFDEWAEGMRVVDAD